MALRLPRHADLPGRTVLGRCVLALWLWLALSLPASAGDPGALRVRHAQLAEALQASAFGRPLHIESRESGDTLHGDIHAVLDHPFERVRDALRQTANWCDVMILPFNTKYCHAVRSASGPGLFIRIGRRWDQALEDSYKLLFDFHLAAANPGYFEARLFAPQGPVSTRDYHIHVSAIPLEEGRTFLRLAYSYGFGFTGRLAMQAYLMTAGADKVGFTRVDHGVGGPRYIGGMRGAVERNAMRYYLAIDSFLESLRLAPAQRAEGRVQAWFEATERYPRQLREMDRATYVGMKRMEIARQQALIQ